MYDKKAFSLIEMLMALLVASLLMAALAPVMTKKMNENVNVATGGTVPSERNMKHVINYNDDNCSEIDTVNNICKGVFAVPNGFNGIMQVTLTGAGGGGGASATTGSIEYTSAGTHTFKVPEGVDEIEVTLVEGGGGGGAGYIKTGDADVKGYAWTFSGTLDRTFVPTNIVSANVQNVTVSGNSVAINQGSYAHGTSTLSGTNTRYIAGGKVFLTMAGGGGGGGRAWAGTGGGGGAAYNRKQVIITNGTAYNISVGAGGKGHACNAGVAQLHGFPDSAGCGGSASTFGGLLTAGGGGGGMWGASYDDTPSPNLSGTSGENGGSGAISGGIGSCTYPDFPLGRSATGGYGASPGGSNGAGRIGCGSTTTYDCTPGSNGGNSTFGNGGIFSPVSSNNRHGQGYGAGGCGSGAGDCSSGIIAYGSDYTGNGAPGFIAAEWYNIAQGGAGGAGASMAVKQRIKVFPGETLTIIVGAGGKGGKSADIRNIGDVTAPKDGESGRPSILKRGSTDLLYTSFNSRTAGTGCNYGACGGNTYGNCLNTNCYAGWVYSGISTNETFSKDGATNTREVSSNTKYPGYKATGGGSSGNKTSGAYYTGTLTVSDTGGHGGQTTIDNQQFCTRGSGSSTIGQNGGSATGYGGCGGGGGYGVADGGDGAPGYAKITWNPDKKGAGGGGGSGNTIAKRNITVKSGSVIKYQIGKGGNGGSISGNNTINDNLSGQAFNDGQKGGDTIFGIGSLSAANNYRITAGGGYGGHSPIISGNSSDVSTVMMANGTGGNKADICKIINTLLTCQGAFNGNDGENSKGGDGANSKYGEGGKGTNNNAGRDTEIIGAGGGGSGVTETNSPSVNNSSGGKGGNGQIILEWQE